MLRLSILTSLYDKDAVNLLRSLDESIESGEISADTHLVCNRLKERMVPREDFDGRLSQVIRLPHVGRSITVFDSTRYKTDQRRQHDEDLVEQLPEADLHLNIGWMYIMTPVLQKLGILNLHPAIPEIGPVGMWPKVMEEQTTRVLEKRLEGIPYEDAVMDPYCSAGGMLHFVTEEMDRGPVVSYYQFPLMSLDFAEFFDEVYTRLQQRHSWDRIKETEEWKQLAGREGLIRQEQFKGEWPLILLTLRYLSHGNWEIRDRTLYIEERAYTEGYDLSEEIGEYLRNQGTSTSIGDI